MSISPHWGKDAHIAATLEGNPRKVCNTSENQKAKLGNVAFWQSKYSIILNKYSNWVKTENCSKVQITHCWQNDTFFAAKKATFDEYSKVPGHATNTDGAFPDV